MAQKIRDLEIDILVDLRTYQRKSRLGVFAENLLTVSIKYWIECGYTTGITAINYFLTGIVMAPKGNDHLFSEKIYHLPHHAAIWDPDSNQMGECWSLITKMVVMLLEPSQSY